MKGKTKTQKGITLIALIITIVVLLILAVVAISSVQNDGILGYATNAATDYNMAVKNESLLLQNYVEFLEKNPIIDNEEPTTPEEPEVQGYKVRVSMEHSESRFIVKFSTDNGVTWKKLSDVLEMGQYGYSGTIHENATQIWLKIEDVNSSDGYSVFETVFSKIREDNVITDKYKTFTGSSSTDTGNIVLTCDTHVEIDTMWIDSGGWT